MDEKCFSWYKLKWYLNMQLQNIEKHAGFLIAYPSLFLLWWQNSPWISNLFCIDHAEDVLLTQWPNSSQIRSKNSLFESLNGTVQELILIILWNNNNKKLEYQMRMFTQAFVEVTMCLAVWSIISALWCLLCHGTCCETCSLCNSSYGKIKGALLCWHGCRINSS